MARVINEEDYAAKRNQILDVMQGIVYDDDTLYERMSVQQPVACIG